MQETSSWNARSVIESIRMKHQSEPPTTYFVFTFFFTLPCLCPLCSQLVCIFFEFFCSFKTLQRRGMWFARRLCRRTAACISCSKQCLHRHISLLCLSVALSLCLSVSLSLCVCDCVPVCLFSVLSLSPSLPPSFSPPSLPPSLPPCLPPSLKQHLHRFASCTRHHAIMYIYIKYLLYTHTHTHTHTHTQTHTRTSSQRTRA